MTSRRILLLFLGSALLTIGARAQGFWYQQVSPTTSELFDIHFVNKNNGWAVGAGGVLLRTVNGGTNWVKNIVSPTNKILRGVHFISTQDGFACGDAGTCIKTNNGGLAWSGTSALPPNNYRALFFSDPQHGWLAGDDGSVAKTTDGGSSWTVIHSSTNLTLYGIQRIPGTPPTIYFCGTGGKVKKSTDEGANWIDVSLPGTNELRGLAFLTTDFGYVAGRDTVYKTTDGGANWTALPSGTMGQLRSITFPMQSTGWTIVSGSNIPYTETGGAGWTVQGSPSSSFMNGMCSYTKDYAWACGENGNIIKYTQFPPQISSAPELDFGILLCEPDNYRTLYVKNIGQGPLDIFSMEVKSPGPDKFEFPINSPTAFPLTVQPNDSVAVVIHWKPFGIGLKDAYLEVTSNDLPRTPWTVPFIARKDSTDFSLSVSALNFIPTCVGEDRDQSLELRPEGTQSLQIVEISKISGSDAFSIYAPALPVSVSPGNHIPISVRFTPGAGGPQSAEYRVRTIPCDRTGTFTVTGTGLETRIVPLPDQVNFGSVIVGRSVTKVITLTNPGSTFANITGIDFDPPVPGLVVENPPPFPLRLNAGAQQTITIRFTPADTFHLSADLVISWDHVCPGSKRIPIQGDAIVQPRILIAPILTFRPLLCQATTTDTFHIVNTGNGPLVISKFEFSGKDVTNFRVIEPALPVAVDTGATLDLVLQFSCADPGDKGAILRILHNDPVNNPTDVVLSGRKDNVGFSIVADSTAPLAVCVGRTARLSFTLVNTGSVPLRIDDIIPSNGNAPFRIQGVTTPFFIAPAASQLVEVEFHPTLPGTYLNAYTVKGDKCGAQHTLLLQGVGMKAEFVTATQVDFGYVTIGGVVTQNVGVVNTGNIPGIVDAVYFSPPVPGLTLTPPPALPFTIDSAGVRSLPIRFSPVADSAYQTELLFILSKECPDTLRIPIRAAGTSASLAADKSRWDVELPACEPGDRCDTLRLRNQGINPVTVTRVFLQQAGTVFRMPMIPPTPARVDPGGTLAVPFCATMPSAGKDSAHLIVESSDTKHPVISLPLLARRDSAAVSYSTDRLDFGLLAQCDTPRVLPMTIRNTGSAPDTVTIDPPADPAFALVGAVRRVVAGGGTEGVLFRFLPVTAGSFAATARLISARCPVAEEVTLAGRKARLRPETSADTLSFPDQRVGAKGTQILLLRNRSAAVMRIDSLRIAPSSEGFSTPGPFPIELQPGGDFSLPVDFTPSSARACGAAATLFVTLPCADTLHVELRGRGVDGELIFRASSLLFDSTAQCQTRIDSVSCVNSGLAPVTILRSSLAGGTPAAFTILNPTTAGELLAPGQSRSYTIAFHPSSAPDGTVSTLLHLDLSGASSPVLELPVDGRKISQTLPILPPVDFAAVDVGTSKSIPVSLTNIGSATFCIDRMTTPPTVTSNLGLPRCVRPGETLAFDLLFSPLDTIPMAGLLVLRIASPCPDSLTVSLSGKGTPGTVAQTPAIRFGMLPRCIAGRDTVVIRNMGLQQIVIDSLFIDGPDSAAFTFISPPAIPVGIAAGGSLRLLLECNPSFAREGSISAEMRARVAVPALLLATRLAADVTTPKLAFAGLRFPAAIVGSSVAQDVVLRNPSGAPITIAAFASSDPQFMPDPGNPPFPWVLSAGDSLAVHMHFSPARIGLISGPARFTASGPCPFLADTLFVGEGLPPPVITAALRMGTIHGRPDQVVDIPILLETDLGAAAVTGYAGDIRFNRTMLYPVGVTREQTLSSGMTLRMQYDQAAGSAHVEADGATVGSGAGALFILRCKVLIGNDVETPLSFSPQFDFTAGNARVGARTEGLFQLEGYCMAGSRLLRIQGNYILEQNRPNPFNPSTRIDYEIAEEEYVTIAVYDSFGRKVRDLVAGMIPAGRHTAEFRADGAASGVYYYAIRTKRFSAVRAMLLAR